jgi:hypothetical protein
MFVECWLDHCALDCEIEAAFAFAFEVDETKVLKMTKVRMNTKTAARRIQTHQQQQMQRLSCENFGWQREHLMERQMKIQVEFECENFLSQQVVQTTRM